ncbi:MAG: redoxin domain-containing protein [Anaerolineales bacterium]|jgi:methylamine dehydrogenase accessory protein MauD
MNANRIERVMLMLMGIVIVLMIMNLGLFLRMNQIQNQVLDAVQPLQDILQVKEGLPPGTEAPSFNLAGTTGQMISLEKFSGQSVLLIFSSPTCSACQQIYPVLKEFTRSYPDISMLMISTGSQEENRILVRDQGFDFPVVSLQKEVASSYQLPGTPYFYLIDESGVITNSGFASSLEELRSLVNNR